MAQQVRNPPAMQETQEIQVWSLGRGDPLEKEMETHFSIFAWRIPWTEGPGGLQSIGSQRVGHEWATNTFTSTSYWGDVIGAGRKTRRQWVEKYLGGRPMETVNLDKITLLRNLAEKGEQWNDIENEQTTEKGFAVVAAEYPWSWSKYLNFYSLTRAWNLDWLQSLSLGEMNPRATQEEETGAHFQIQESLSLIFQKPLTPDAFVISPMGPRDAILVIFLTISEFHIE